MAARNALKASRGFKFVKRGSKVMLMKNDGGGGGLSFSCACHVGTGTPGTCKVVIEPSGDTISCEKETCGGVCKWEIKIPGLATRAFLTPA